MQRKTNWAQSANYISNVLFKLSLLSAGCYLFFDWLDPKSSNTAVAGRCALCFFAVKEGVGYLVDADINAHQNNGVSPSDESQGNRADNWGMK